MPALGVLLHVRRLVVRSCGQRLLHQRRSNVCSRAPSRRRLCRTRAVTMAAVYESEVKLFGKWSYDELVCEDISLTVRLWPKLGRSPADCVCVCAS